MDEGNDFAALIKNTVILHCMISFELMISRDEIIVKVSGQDVSTKFWLHGNYLKSSFGKKFFSLKNFIKDIMMGIPRKI